MIARVAMMPPPRCETCDALAIRLSQTSAGNDREKPKLIKIRKVELAEHPIVSGRI
jgi:hypothetical protein